MFKFIHLFVVTLVFLSITACSSDHSGSKSRVNEIRVGLLPVDTPEKLNQRYSPLFTYVTAQAGVPFKLIIATDYEDLLELFHLGKINMAVFGGVTFVKAHKNDNALPLVARRHKTRFVSYFLSRTSDKRMSIADFKGAKFSFGSRLSTSGHLMPRFFLTEQGINAEQFFGEVMHSGKHAQTASWVRDGKVDIAAVNSAVVDKMYEDGRLSEQQVRILWKSPPYPDQVFGIAPGIDSKLRSQLRDAFLSLTVTNPEHAVMLDAISADGFIPVQLEEYSQLTKVIDQQGLL